MSSSVFKSSFEVVVTSVVKNSGEGYKIKKISPKSNISILCELRISAEPTKIGSKFTQLLLKLAGKVQVFKGGKKRLELSAN